jgi:hypothetical protein
LSGFGIQTSAEGGGKAFPSSEQTPSCSPQYPLLPQAVSMSEVPFLSPLYEMRVNIIHGFFAVCKGFYSKYITSFNFFMF